MWTILNNGRYVKDSRYCNMKSKSSYTRDPQKAVKYNTEEEAKKNACGNEQVVKMHLIYA
jgi:hypothetical protein